ncbi:MAG: ABC transporter permease [Candidatus Rokubacteria bacterium]|nr:ABC transporter permease [Candidatus Rokubacteria bacterium]
MSSAYLIRRLAQSILLLVGVTLVAFALLHLTPGDPAEMVLGENATPEQVAALRTRLGLDRPYPEQYVLYVGRLLRGDLGDSLFAQRPVLAYVLERMPATGRLALAAVALALLVGIPLGMLAAVRRESSLDYAARGLSLLAQSIPGMWLGLMLITVFAVWLRLLPAIGAETTWHLALPAVTLASYIVGLVVRLTRSSVLDVLFEDYVRTARAKGLAESAVLLRHVLRNALVPVVTVLGLQLGALLGGAVITEAVFAWPGLGSLVLQAISQRDYPVVQAVVLLSALTFVVINFVVDLLNLWLNPRLRLEGGEG